MNYAIIINTLEYVFKGGRISKVQYMQPTCSTLTSSAAQTAPGKLSLPINSGERKSILR